MPTLLPVGLIPTPLLKQAIVARPIAAELDETDSCYEARLVIKQLDATIDESTKEETTDRHKSKRKDPTLARILSFSMYTHP